MEDAVLTCSIRQLIFLALYSVLQRLRISACYLDLLLDRFSVRVGHAVRLRLAAAPMPVAKWRQTEGDCNSKRKSAVLPATPTSGSAV